MSSVTNRQQKARRDGSDEQALKALQTELQALKQIHSSLEGVLKMVSCFNQNVHCAIKSNNEHADLNKGWQIFFTGQK